LCQLRVASIGHGVQVADLRWIFALLFFKRRGGVGCCTPTPNFEKEESYRNRKSLIASAII